MDRTPIAAGLLHDSVEDTPVTEVEIRKEFGDQVAHIVEGVTKIDKIEFANREDRQAENVRKMLLAMVGDVRVVLIKLADRLHNMRTLEHLKPERQESDCARDAGYLRAAGAPAGHGQGARRTGGPGVSAIPIPVSYEQVSAAVEARRVEGEQFLARRGRHAGGAVRENGIEARVEWRIKRLYSVHKKLQRPRIGVDQVYDLLAIRVITQDVCRTAMRFRAHPHAVAAGAGAHQGFHCDAARQPLPVAAYHGDGRRRAPV